MPEVYWISPEDYITTVESSTSIPRPSSLTPLPIEARSWHWNYLMHYLESGSRRSWGWFRPCGGVGCGFELRRVHVNGNPLQASIPKMIGIWLNDFDRLLTYTMLSHFCILLYQTYWLSNRYCTRGRAGVPLQKRLSCLLATAGSKEPARLF